MNNPQSQTIVQRFFTALDLLKERKIIRGRQTFTTKYGINRRNLWHLENDLACDQFQVSWLELLVKDFGMDAHWLLTGNGEPFGKDKTRNRAKIVQKRISANSKSALM